MMGCLCRQRQEQKLLCAPAHRPPGLNPALHPTKASTACRQRYGWRARHLPVHPDVSQSHRWPYEPEGRPGYGLPNLSGALVFPRHLLR